MGEFDKEIDKVSKPVKRFIDKVKDFVSENKWYFAGVLATVIFFAALAD